MHMIHRLVGVIERSSAEHEVVCRELPFEKQLGWGVLWREMAETLSPRQAIQDQQNLATAAAFGGNALNILNTQEDMVVLDSVVKLVHSSNAKAMFALPAEMLLDRMAANDVGTPVPFVAKAFDDTPVFEMRPSNVVLFRQHNRAA